MEKNKQRRSNIELLRIIAISFVVILHYNNAQMGGGFLYAYGINNIVLNVLECMSICAVEIFIICSGYFLCNTQKRTFSKPFFLVIQVIIMQHLSYAVSVWLNGISFKWSTVVADFLPQNWFITLYIVLYFISPYINIVLNYLEDKKNKIFLFLIFFLFSVYPTCLYAFECLSGKELAGMNTIESTVVPNGYSTINFVLLYIIGALIRKMLHKKMSKPVCVIIYLLNVTIIFALSMLLPQIAYQYYSPFVILCAVSLFLLFKEFDIKNQVINFISKSTFTVFLLHYCVLQNVKIQVFVQKNAGIMLLHIVMTLAVVWFVCIIINTIYSFCIEQIKKIFGENCIINREYEV